MTPAGTNVATPKNEKHREYARYAAHCLNMVAATKDQAERTLSREMAAEWVKLAEMALHPLKTASVSSGPVIIGLCGDGSGCWQPLVQGSPRRGFRRQFQD